MRFYHRLFSLVIAPFLAACVSFPSSATNVSTRQTAVITHVVHPHGAVENFRLVAVLPSTLANRQTVHSLTTNPAARLFSENGNQYAEWSFTPEKNKKYELTITADITLYPSDFTATAAAETSENIAHDSAVNSMDLTRWLVAEPKIEKDDPAIQDFARNATAEISGKKNAIMIAQKILEKISHEIRYAGFIVEDDGAAKALISRRGDCTDFTDLFVAALRSQNIPAKHVSGILTVWEQIPTHSWAEFYAPNHGWIRVDPLYEKLGKVEFGKTAARYLELSSIRNDPVLQNGMLYFWELKGDARASATVSQTVAVFVK